MLDRLSLLMLLLARWCVSLAVLLAPDGAAVILAISHGDSGWSRLQSRCTPEQAARVAREARIQAAAADRRARI